MRNHEYRPDPEEPTPVPGKPMIGATPFGAVIFFPQSKVGLTLVQLADGTTRRVRGFEKRMLLSLLGAVEQARVRPLPSLFMN